jgi:hypothetical protein
MYVKLLMETLLLGAALVVGLLATGFVRSALRGISPRLLWAGPGGEVAGPAGLPIHRSFGEGRLYFGDMLPLVGMDWPVAVPVGKKGQPAAKPQAGVRAQTGMFLAVGLVMAAVLLLSLMRSGDRGQIIFAMFASFFLASLVAQQLFPRSLGGLAWIMPFVLAVVFYALGAASVASSDPQAWIRVPDYARALPIDWLTAGVSGALAGCWTSSRIHEERLVEQQGQAEGA